MSENSFCFRLNRTLNLTPADFVWGVCFALFCLLFVLSCTALHTRLLWSGCTALSPRYLWGSRCQDELSGQSLCKVSTEARRPGIEVISPLPDLWCPHPAAPL